MAQTWNSTLTGSLDTIIGTQIPANLTTLRTEWSGTVAPTSPVAFQLWADTTTGTLKRRDSGNSAWDVLGPLNSYSDNGAPILVGGISATGSVVIAAPRKSMFVASVVLVSDTATTSDGSNNWAFSVTNETQALDLLASAVNTNGADLAVNTAYVLTMDQNQTIAARDVVRIHYDKTGSATSMVQVSVMVEGYLVG